MWSRTKNLGVIWVFNWLRGAASEYYIQMLSLWAMKLTSVRLSTFEKMIRWTCLIWADYLKYKPEKKTDRCENWTCLSKIFRWSFRYFCTSLNGGWFFFFGIKIYLEISILTLRWNNHSSFHWRNNKYLTLILIYKTRCLHSI